MIDFCVYWTGLSHRLTVNAGGELWGWKKKKTGKVHGLTLKERKYGKLTGVQDIHSFNENEILLQTEAGKVQIKGEQLHVKSLDLEKGEAEIEGKVNSVSYLTKNAQKKEEPLLKRMFR